MAEVMIHALPSGVHATGRTGLRLGVVLGPCSHVEHSPVGWPLTQSLPTDVFGLPDHDFDMGVDTKILLEHCVASMMVLVASLQEEMVNLRQ